MMDCDMMGTPSPYILIDPPSKNVCKANISIWWNSLRRPGASSELRLALLHRSSSLAGTPYRMATVESRSGSFCNRPVMHLSMGLRVDVWPSSLIGRRLYRDLALVRSASSGPVCILMDQLASLW